MKRRVDNDEVLFSETDVAVLEMMLRLHEEFGFDTIVRVRVPESDLF